MASKEVYCDVHSRLEQYEHMVEVVTDELLLLQERLGEYPVFREGQWDRDLVKDMMGQALKTVRDYYRERMDWTPSDDEEEALWAAIDRDDPLVDGDLDEAA